MSARQSRSAVISLCCVSESDRVVGDAEICVCVVLERAVRVAKYDIPVGE